MSTSVTRKILIPKTRGSIKRSEIRAAVKYAKAQRTNKTFNKEKMAENAFRLLPAD